MSETRPEPRQRHFRNAWLSLLVALGGVLVSLLVSGTVRNHTQQQAQERFERHAERIENEVRRRFDLPLYSLRGAVGLHAGSARVDLAEFRAFIDALNLRETLPGVRGLGLIERVPSAATADHQARGNAGAGPGFKTRPVPAPHHAPRHVGPPPRGGVLCPPSASPSWTTWPRAAGTPAGGPSGATPSNAPSAPAAPP